MRGNPIVPVVVGVSVALTAPAVRAETIDMRLFGNHVAVTKGGEGEELSINDRKVLANYSLSLDEFFLVDGVPVAVGISFAGGNACEGAPFLLSFPKGAAPRLDGPLDTCFSVKTEATDGSLTLSTAATPSEPGETWRWTPDGGLKKGEPVAFAANTSKGWPQLRERTVSHPGELYDFAEIGSEIDRLAGTDKSLVADILMGVGSGEFHGDAFVGTACSRHMCQDQEAIVIADGAARTIYLAWKPSGQKIKVNPPVKEWPTMAKGELRDWAAKWK